MNVEKVQTNVCGSRTVGILAACVGMLLCVPVHALSLGGIQVKSALDEPLKAEITLNSVDAETLESLEVTLGSTEDFQRAAVPRTEFLQALQFSVTEEGGEPVVQITTEQPVKEPFLHFLIAAEWSGGKLVREYTGLLDPPLYTADEPAPVEAPAGGEVTAMEETGEMATTEMETAEPEPAETSDTSGASSTMTAAPGRSAEFGPTQDGDTLWAIASKLETGSMDVNVFQIMVALLRENPEAFINNNINRLRSGQVLRLQDLGSIAAVTPEEASAVYTAQLEEWQSFTAEVAAAGGEPAAAADTADASETAAATGDETAATADTADEAAAESTAQQAAGDDEVLRIVQATVEESEQSQAAGAGADRSGEIAELRGQIATLQESLESRNLENQELQERVRMLEGQLENAQRLIEIESEELAAAQQRASELQAEAEAAREAEAEARQAAQESAAQTAAVEPEASTQTSQAMQEETAPAAETGGEQAETSMASVDSAGDEGAATQQQGTQSAQQAAGTTTAAATGAAQSGQETQKVRKVAGRPPQGGAWWSGLPDMLFSSWMWMVGAGIGVLVLVLGLLMFLRRRQSIAEFEESILSGSALDSYSETTDTASSSASDTSFLSDFGTAGMGTMQADEVDPLAEAEVYLAYGRDEQAEEVLKEAARRDPERSEIKLKLLEIYKQRSDVKSFETIAEELYPASEQEDPEIWRQVAAMGRELNPGNPLFQESETASDSDTQTGATPSTATTAQRPAAPEAGAAAAAGMAATAAASEGSSEDTLDFDLDDLGGPDTPLAGDDTVEPKVEQDVESLDLDDVETAARPESMDEPTVAQAQEGEDNTLDLGDEFLQQASRNVDPSSQPFPQPDQQTDLDRELERLAGERESATTQIRPAETGAGDKGDTDEASREMSWDTASSDSETLDFPASEASEIDFDLNLDESSIPSQAEGSGGDGQPEPEVETTSGEPGALDTGEGLLEFESENIPPEETWAGASSDTTPAEAAGEDTVPYAPEEDVQSEGAPQYNEAETKLDLARAYLDMGDKVGARSIIDEVMREGDPAQRDRAAELASQL